MKVTIVLALLIAVALTGRAQDKVSCSERVLAVAEFVNRTDLYRTLDTSKHSYLIAQLYRERINDAIAEWQAGTRSPATCFRRLNNYTMQFSKAAPFAEEANNDTIVLLRTSMEAQLGQAPDCVVWDSSPGTIKGEELRQELERLKSQMLEPVKPQGMTDRLLVFAIIFLVLTLWLFLHTIWLHRQLHTIVKRQHRHSDRIEVLRTAPAPSAQLAAEDAALLTSLKSVFPGAISSNSIRKALQSMVKASMPQQPTATSASPKPPAQQPATPTPAPKKLVRFAQPPVHEGAAFEGIAELFDPNSSYYRLEFEPGAQQASYTVVDNESSQERAIRAFEDYLLSACNIKGEKDKARKRIRTIEAGIAVLEGDKWKVKSPTEIELL